MWRVARSALESRPVSMATCSLSTIPSQKPTKGLQGNGMWVLIKKHSFYHGSQFLRLPYFNHILNFSSWSKVRLLSAEKRWTDGSVGHPLPPSMCASLSEKDTTWLFNQAKWESSRMTNTSKLGPFWRFDRTLCASSWRPTNFRMISAQPRWSLVSKKFRSINWFQIERSCNISADLLIIFA